MKRLMIPILALMLLATYACEEQDCDRTFNHQAGVGLYTIQDSVAVDSLPPNITIYGTTRPDSLLYDSASVSSLLLPLDPSRNHSRFIVKINALADTLDLHYNREQKFVSHNCGFTTEFTLEEAQTTFHHFDSVRIVKHTINPNEQEENIRLYLTPADTAGR